jgi:phage shock protein PspC (stress-responsive transcriptional regulator)
MKRVETISINGVIFRITDDACRTLSDYLESLYKSFEHEEGGDEIITDIEARIAELLVGRAGGATQAITNNDVLHVIETLGALEDITSSDNGGSGNKPLYENPDKYIKRLYRDPDHRIFGGVCAGIAARLEISPVIARLIFIACILFYGVSVIFYFLLWIIIPSAKTTAQKLEMQGQPLNISNIERSIRDNVASSSNLKPSSRRYAGETGGGNSSWKIIWDIIRVVAGIILCCIGISTALALCGLLLLHDIIAEWHFLPFNFVPRIISTSSYNAIFLSMALFILLTVAACIYWGIKAITGTKVKYPPVHIILLIIWFITIPVGVSYLVREVGNYFWYNESTRTTRINASDTIYLNMKPSNLGILNYTFGTYFDDDDNRVYGKPEMYIRKSDGMPEIKLVMASRGKNKRAALMSADNIDFRIETVNSQITVPPYFTVEPLNKWKSQHVKIILSIPENTVIIVDKSLCHSDIIISPRRSGHDGNACKWIMTKEGIKALD